MYSVESVNRRDGTYRCTELVHRALPDADQPADRRGYYLFEKIAVQREGFEGHVRYLIPRSSTGRPSHVPAGKVFNSVHNIIETMHALLTRCRCCHRYVLVRAQSGIAVIDDISSVRGRESSCSCAADRESSCSRFDIDRCRYRR